MSRGCDPRSVGDGKCDIACYNEACRWDGNDCGGPALNVAGIPPAEVPDASILINRGTDRDVCMLKVADIVLTPTAGMPATQPGWRFNYWEECNGVGTCGQVGVGAPFTCSCPNNCGSATGLQRA